MFNREKIEALTHRVDSLGRERDSLQSQVWELRNDLEELLKRLGLTFQTVNERRLVAVVKPKTETEI